VRGYARAGDVFPVESGSCDDANSKTAALSPLLLPTQIACQDGVWENGP
jgi:hypothetical protein